jgi:terminal uridylyltransferase
MDLVIVVQGFSQSAATCFSLFEADLPRALEKRLLQVGHGARLLSRTRGN